MKKIMKKVLFVLLAIVVYLGVITILPTSTTLSKPNDNDEEVIQLASSDDIEGWDIDVNNVKQVEIHAGSNGNGPVDVVLTEEEGLRIIHAFNAIQNKDINWDESLENAYEFGPIGIGITVVMNDGEKIVIGPSQDYRLGYKGELYATRYQLDIYDEVRQLQTKYGFQWTNNSLGHQMKDFESNILFGTENDCVVNPNIMMIQTSPYRGHLMYKNYLHVITTLPFYGFKTFNEYLKPYEGELVLNDTIETNNFIIKVIEIIDGEVTAISVSNK